jgi:altronate dehydratase
LGGAIILADGDNVAVMAGDVAAGTNMAGVTTRDAIAKGHKIALRPITAGDAVTKYGQIIGVATTDIAPGSHVHTHNLGIASKVEVRGDVAPRPHPVGRATDTRFRGFRRADGQSGTRNYIGVISSVNCSATVVRQIARGLETLDRPSVDGVAAFTHASGCGMPKQGDGIEILERTIAGYARNPNFGGLLLVGLGCEVAQIGDLLDHYDLRESRRLRTLTIQEAGGTAAAIAEGRRLVGELIEEADADRRESLPISELTLGLQCGASDAWSGITANPALGIAADLMVAEGATVILSETPEIFGAEHLLLDRTPSAAVAAALTERLDWWKAYALRNGASLDNNPSPGNKAGGLTTIYEKSLGAVAKAGSSPLVEVCRYGERPSKRGLIFMDSPGYDPCSATGQVAAGANLLAFTTGRGSTFGSKPTPCLKIASNADLARRMSDDIDVDCSPILDGLSTEEAGRTIFDRLIDMACGTPTKSEVLGIGDHEFVPWQLGAWM